MSINGELFIISLYFRMMSGCSEEVMGMIIFVIK